MDLRRAASTGSSMRCRPTGCATEPERAWPAQGAPRWLYAPQCCRVPEVAASLAASPASRAGPRRCRHRPARLRRSASAAPASSAPTSEAQPEAWGHGMASASRTGRDQIPPSCCQRGLASTRWYAGMLACCKSCKPCWCCWLFARTDSAVRPAGAAGPNP